MKRAEIILFALACALALSACSSKRDEPSLAGAAFHCLLNPRCAR